MRRSAKRKNKNSGFLKTVFFCGAVFSAVALCVFYVWQVNKEVEEKYSFEKCLKKIETLERENKQLEVNFSQAFSLDSLKEQAGLLGFQKADKIQYLKVMDNRVVANYNEAVAD